MVTGKGARFGGNFNSADVQVEPAGTVTLTFTACEGLTLAYAGAQSFTHGLQRLVGPLAGLGCTTTLNQPAPNGDQQHTFQIVSPETGFTYDVAIWVPPGYNPSSRLHPVIYAADMEPQVLSLKNIVRANGHNAVIVAVSNGGPDRRFVDYTFPGAADYHDFLVHRLMPYVETQYRVDRTRRIFAGYSLSGSFASITMALDDPAARRWYGLVSVDGSFWYETESLYEAEQAMFNATKALPVKLYLAAAANLDGITSFRQRLESRGYRGLQVKQQNYALNHGEVLVPGLTDGLAWVLEEN